MASFNAVMDLYNRLEKNTDRFALCKASTADVFIELLNLRTSSNEHGDRRNKPPLFATDLVENLYKRTQEPVDTVAAEYGNTGTREIRWEISNNESSLFIREAAELIAEFSAIWEERSEHVRSDPVGPRLKLDNSLVNDRSRIILCLRCWMANRAWSKIQRAARSRKRKELSDKLEKDHHESTPPFFRSSSTPTTLFRGSLQDDDDLETAPRSGQLCEDEHVPDIVDGSRSEPSPVQRELFGILLDAFQHNAPSDVVKELYDGIFTDTVRSRIQALPTGARLTKSITSWLEIHHRLLEFQERTNYQGPPANWRNHLNTLLRKPDETEKAWMKRKFSLMQAFNNLVYWGLQQKDHSLSDGVASFNRSLADFFQELTQIPESECRAEEWELGLSIYNSDLLAWFWIE